ncbi:hypothetical protein ABXV19_11195 [Pseudomonas alkylphenolica]|uniref:hypothetical protein n=1 Tax=Pseudomonas TaxID=286 RepID=UPI000C6D9B89|nr:MULTISPECIES: hypothetical protein [unclassified Pseudomonas]QYX48285.1 hypothetical protein K3F43_01880 [Pseudomonas sp. S11A 273]
MKSGDYFAIPMDDGRFAISQIIWMGGESKDKKFKNVFAFGVLSVGESKTVPDGGGYLNFKDHKGEFFVVFTAVDKLKTGEWLILKDGKINDPYLIEFEFNVAGTLYRLGHPVRVLAIEEYQNYLLMSVSGYALVERFLHQH